MDDGKTGLGIAVVGAVLLVVFLAVVGLATVYTGAYNIAATEEHTALVRWAFATTFRNSIKSRAAGIQPPAAISPEIIATGASSYKQMCEHCHAGPGVKRAEWASGMRPRPPHLKEAAARWKAQEIFWLVKHGAKMTGMPAFGSTHDDQTIWSIAAFVKEMPAMTPETYAALGKSSGGRGHSMSAGDREGTKR
nr:Cytochrome C family protein, di-heme cytochrome C (Class I) [Methylocystis sp. SC2]